MRPAGVAWRTASTSNPPAGIPTMTSLPAKVETTTLTKTRAISAGQVSQIYCDILTSLMGSLQGTTLCGSTVSASSVAGRSSGFDVSLVGLAIRGEWHCFDEHLIHTR